MSKGAYDIILDHLGESRLIDDPIELLKLKLSAEFLKITAKMNTDEIMSLTGLHKSDLSRIRSMNIERFSIDKMISILDALGYSTKLSVMRKKAS